jgi:hypothetical protein
MDSLFHKFQTSEQPVVDIRHWNLPAPSQLLLGQKKKKDIFVTATSYTEGLWKMFSSIVTRSQGGWTAREQIILSRPPLGPTSLLWGKGVFHLAYSSLGAHLTTPLYLKQRLRMYAAVCPFLHIPLWQAQVQLHPQLLLSLEPHYQLNQVEYNRT